MRRKVGRIVVCGMVAMFLGGCQKEENLVDIETPDGSIEVNEGADGIEVEIESEE